MRLHIWDMSTNDLSEDVINRFRDRIHQNQEISNATEAVLDRRLSHNSFGDNEDVLSEIIERKQS
jgi:hypothetical protein